MRNIGCVLLFIVLCSNECNAPYRAKIACVNTADSCRFRFQNSLEFSIKDASVSWWKGSVDIGIYYRARNTSATVKDSIDYSRFSVVCSNGMKLLQARPPVYTYAPSASLDTIFVFSSADKYSKGRGMEILKKERFYLVYGADTLAEVRGDDEKMR